MKLFKKVPVVLVMILFAAAIFSFIQPATVKAAEDKKTAVTVNAAADAETGEAAETVDTAAAEQTKGKAIGAAIVVGLAACGGAVAMGMSVSKSSEAIARQPEAEGKIRTSLMLGLVFIETAIIYALIVAILIIFVM